MTGLKIMVGVVALLSSTGAMAQAGSWSVTEASGRVVIRDGGGDHVAQRGSRVPAGATLLTGGGARAVLVRDEDFVTVASNSRLRVPGAEQSAGLFQMIQEWGNAVFRIKHLPRPHFAVQTPYLAAVVKGTTFSVTVSGEGASLQVIDGAVEVATTDGGAHELVRPGVVAAIAAGDRYRLSVQGQNAHVVDSPQRAAGAPDTRAPAAAAESGSGETARADAHRDDVAWNEVSSSLIAAPIEAKPVDLAGVTGGLVTGHTGPELAAASVARAANGSVELASGTPVPAARGAGKPAKADTPPADQGSPKNGKADPASPGGTDDAAEPASPATKNNPADKALKPGKDDPVDRATKPGKDDPADPATKLGKDDPVDTAPKPGKDDPVDTAPKPGKDDPVDAAPKPGEDDPAVKAPKPGKDDPSDKGSKPGKD